MNIGDDAVKSEGRVFSNNGGKADSMWEKKIGKEAHDVGSSNPEIFSHNLFDLGP